MTRQEKDSFGLVTVAADRLWGAQTQRSLVHFPYLKRAHAGRVDPCTGGGQALPAPASIGSLACCRTTKPAPSSRPPTRCRRPACRRISAVRLANRLRHAEQHEHERGAGQPRIGTARRRTRQRPPGAPERRRQSRAVVERHLPDRHAPCRRDSASPAACCPRCARCAHPGRQIRGLRRHRQDRPHPLAGCHPADARPGILRLCRPAAARRGGDPCRPALALPNWRWAARRSAPA